MSKKLRLLSFVMMILILVVSLPMYAFASGIDSEAEEITVDNTTYVLKELTDRREANVKYYLLSDRTSRAVVYPYDVHYLDENGEWQDIDNTLTLSQGNYEAKGKTEIKFAKKSGSTGLVSIKDGGYKIDFTPMNASKSTAEITNTEQTDSRKYDDVKLLSGIKSEVLYEDIYENTDIQYILKGLCLKENIIVKNARDSYSYEFELKLNGLKAELDEGKIVLSDYDTSEVKYIIPAPYMRDANGNYSNKVEYTLINESKWQYKLTVTADSEWINSEETVFPVTIDPTFETYNSGYIASKENMDMGILFIGANQMMGGVSEVYCPVTLPSIPSTAMITSVKMGVYCDEVSTSALKVGAYRVTGSWTSSSILSSEPSIASTPVDYIHMKTYYPTWDITELVKGWQNGTYSNYGVCLKEMTGSTSAYAVIVEDATILEVSYIDTIGIEEYFSYYSSSVSGGGTGYVNSYTGGLTFAHNIFSTADEAMPYSLSYVYTAPGSWKLSSVETLTQTTLADGQTCFVWVDGDGSSHYFTKIREKTNYGTYKYYEYDSTGNLVQNNSTTKYYDNEGLGLKLIPGASSNKYIISDDEGNQKYFTGGKIVQIVDSIGNKKQFSYSSANTSAITFYPKGNSSGISQITITNTNGYPTKITNVQTGVYVDFTYSGTKLTQAVYTYGTGATETVVFGYDSSNRLTSVKNNTTGKGVEYSYSGNKVIKITEVAYEGSARNEGNYADISYSTGFTTYRTPGSNRSSTSDDILTVYKFDYKGRVITAYTTDEQGHIYGSSSYAYNDMNTSADASVKTNNTLSSVIQSSYNSVNLICNPDFEASSSSLTNWTADSACTIVTALSEASVNIANSNKAKIIRTSSGTSKMYQEVYLTAGTYTFSASLNVKELGTVGSVYLRAYPRGTSSYTTNTITKDNAVNTSVWHKDSVSFTVSTAGYYCVEIGLTTSSSTQSVVYVDEVMLEKSTGMGTFSSYGNGSFESTSDMGSGSGSTTSVQKIEGLYSLRLSSSVTSSSVYRTKTIIPETDDSPFQSRIVSAWAYAPDCVQSANTTNSPATFAIYVKSYYQDGQTETNIIPFNPQHDGWQYACGMVPMTHMNGGLSANPITKIEITIRYDYNIGYAYFDNVTVQRAVDFTAYEYNPMGYMTEADSSDGQTTSYTYDSTQTKVTKVIDKEDRNYLYDYNTDGTISSSGYKGTSTVEKFGIDYTYSMLGLPMNIETTASINGTTKKILTKTTYNTDTTKAYYTKPATTTDERGNVTKYFYYSNGLLKGMCLNDSIGTLYEYNAYGVLICAKEAVYSNGDIVAKSSPSSVLYTYNSKLELSTITTSTTLYQMYYDVFGKTDYMQVGNSTIADYTYASNNGNLTRLDYGNGAYVTYTYDKLDRVVGECYNGVQRATYTYAPNGSISMITDHSNGTNYLYYYSSNGELASVRVSDSSGELKYISRYAYDEFGKLINKNIYFTTDIQTNALAYNVTYNYDSDGNIVSVINGPGTESYIYDNLGRLSTNKFSTILTDSYTYLDGTSSTYTTSLVGSVSTTVNGSTSSVTYTYDARGNITKETYSTGQTIRYEYDDLDQLVAEYNDFARLAYKYTYDNGGNILTKTEYMYRNGTLGLAGSTYTYTYGNSNWKDQLSAINGTTITYDGIGNPLSYYNGYTFTWQNGRELATAGNGTNSISYKYNTDGIRVSKIVNGILHEYTLDGTKIVREVIYTGSTNSYAIDEDLRYFYDANGYLSTIDRLQYDGGSSYTRTYYFAKTNLQGDVLALYTYSGSTATQVASYRYDAWGNDVSLTSAGSNDIATLNPFRYRSYYYDAELGMYYLNTRYYDPAIGRFINADEQLNDGIVGYNMYSYCENNPVMRVDPNGDAFLAFLGKVLLETAISSVIEIASQVVQYGEVVDWKAVGKEAIKGAVSGVLGGFSSSVSKVLKVSKFGTDLVADGISAVVGDMIDGNITSMSDLGESFYNGAAKSFVSNSVSYASEKIVKRINLNKFNGLKRSQKKRVLTSDVFDCRQCEGNKLLKIYRGTNEFEKYISRGSGFASEITGRGIDIVIDIFT